MRVSDIKKMPYGQLEKARDAKVEWLKKVVRFVDDMIQECGVSVEKGGGSSCCTPMKSELYNFNNFSFYADFARSQKDGNEVTIWFHPDCKAMSFEKLRGMNPILDPVLRFHFAAVSPDSDDGVEIQSDDEDWKKRLDEMMLFPDKFIKLHQARSAAEKIEQEKQGQKFEADRDKAKALHDLQNQAERLKV